MSDIIISEDGHRGAIEIQKNIFQAYVSKQNGEMMKMPFIMGGKKAMQKFLDDGAKDIDVREEGKWTAWP